MKTIHPLPPTYRRHVRTPIPTGFSLTYDGYASSLKNKSGVPLVAISRHLRGHYHTYTHNGYAKSHPNLSSAFRHAINALN